VERDAAVLERLSPFSVQVGRGSRVGVRKGGSSDDQGGHGGRMGREGGRGVDVVGGRDGVGGGGGGSGSGGCFLLEHGRALGKSGGTKGGERVRCGGKERWIEVIWFAAMGQRRRVSHGNEGGGK
jgi:hypothetical protein